MMGLAPPHVAEGRATRRRVMTSLLKSRRVWLFTSVTAQLLVMIGLLASLCGMRFWVAGFAQEEYRMTFKDRAGRPVRGVQLRVENESGSNFYHFPVTD